MAKPKTPLLSLGARGTIADSLTFQKRRQLTIAREKPIPTDPKSPAQLTQRQKYKDAVSAWHALTPEEKEAWRGVCPGLTAYQCFMQAKIRELLGPPPPPPEFTEEQTQHNVYFSIGMPLEHSCGQCLTIPNRKVSKLGFWLYKYKDPPGTITMEIYRKSDLELLASKLWGNAIDLPSTATYEEVEFDALVTIDDEVYIVATATGSDASNHTRLCFQASDVKPDEHFCDHNAGWSEYPEYDTAYRYKYYLP